MPNINLLTKNISRKTSKPIKKSLFVGISILVLSLVLYLVLVLTNRGIALKIKTAQNEYGVEYDNFLSGNGGEILDFKNRSEIAEGILAKNESVVNILNQIENSILPMVYLDSLKYDKDKKTVVLEGTSDNFQMLAEQVLSFKQNNFFSAVIPGHGFLDTNNNKIKFSINLIIK